jgi:hypothetical protein
MAKTSMEADNGHIHEGIIEPNIRGPAQPSLINLVLSNDPCWGRLGSFGNYHPAAAHQAGPPPPPPVLGFPPVLDNNIYQYLRSFPNFCREEVVLNLMEHSFGPKYPHLLNRCDQRTSMWFSATRGTTGLLVQMRGRSTADHGGIPID